MSTGEIRVGDIGTQFLITVNDQDNVAVDISSATTIQIILKKPGGTVLTKTALLNSDGTDGKMYYNSVSGDLDECGRWKLQGRVVIGSNDWKTDIETFKVYRNLS